MIFIENKDSTLQGIYCHHDGYIGHVGEYLVKHYDTEEKVRELVALGAISSLSDTVEKTKQDAYHYCANEDLDIREYTNFSELTYADYEEYNYIFKNNEWYLLADRKNIKLKDILKIYEILDKLDIEMYEDNKIAIASVFDELVEYKNKVAQ
jgi:hypothetical protein